MSQNTRIRRRPARGTTWQRLCGSALALPGVTEGTSYGTPALHVRKKLLARLREDGATVAVRIESLDRDVLLAADPKAFFLTDHYRAYPWVLVRLADVHHEAALELIEQAWRRVAPTRLVATRTDSDQRRTGKNAADRAHRRRRATGQ